MGNRLKYSTKVYLENLRRSGKTNMYGAAPYLVKDLGMSNEEAIEALKSWMIDSDPTDYRICEKCGKAMDEGFVFNDGMAYYCSEKCLHQDYTEEEYQELYDEDVAFYTEWYDE